MKKKVTDYDVIATIAEKELKDLAIIDGGVAEDSKVNFYKLKNFFKKHLKRDENGKINQELEEKDKIPLGRKR